MRMILLIAAAICFVLHAFDVNFKPDLVWTGVALICLAFALDGVVPWARKP